MGGSEMTLGQLWTLVVSERLVYYKIKRRQNSEWRQKQREAEKRKRKRKRRNTGEIMDYILTDYTYIFWLQDSLIYRLNKRVKTIVQRGKLKVKHVELWVEYGVVFWSDLGSMERNGCCSGVADDLLQRCLMCCKGWCGLCW